jgi:hypothetical protein
MTLSVTVRAATERQACRVVLTPRKGAAIDVSADEARELQRQILSAAIACERGAQRVVATKKAREQRELRRAAAVDQQLREREG